MFSFNTKMCFDFNSNYNYDILLNDFKNKFGLKIKIESKYNYFSYEAFIKFG